MVTQTWIPGITRTFCIEVNGTFLPINSSLIQLQPLDTVTSKDNSPYQTDGGLYTTYNESDVITQDEGLEVTVVTDMRKTASEQHERFLPGEITVQIWLSVSYCKHSGGTDVLLFVLLVHLLVGTHKIPANKFFGFFLKCWRQLI